MSDYTYHTSFGAVPLNEEKYHNLRLNDFKSFDDFLFLKGEEKDFSKFVVDHHEALLQIESISPGETVIYIPFYEPQNIVEYQVNHYVLWGVLSFQQWCNKPDYIVSPDGEFTHFFPDKVPNRCYACGFCDDDCEHCPIDWLGYESVDFYCQCEERPSLYRRWCNVADVSEEGWGDGSEGLELEDLAMQIAVKEWREV